MGSICAMDILQNPHRSTGLTVDILRDIPAPSTDAASVQALLARCPDAAETDMLQAPRMAQDLKIARLSVKDERGRMGLGSFKALGAAYVIAHSAIVKGEAQSAKTYVTASAGNHGLSVAAGAKAFGAASVIFLSQSVPEAFAERLIAQGATVERAGETYEQSMSAAQAAAEDNGWTLLSDSSWPGYSDLSHRLMEGYTVFMAEAERQISAPTHIFLQAGVGGLAGAAAAMARKLWGDAPVIVVVEPQHAPALHGCIQAGDFVACQRSRKRHGAAGLPGGLFDRPEGAGQGCRCFCAHQRRGRPSRRRLCRSPSDGEHSLRGRGSGGALGLTGPSCSAQA
jgi:diaminopropionate ammonia-lyase